METEKSIRITADDGGNTPKQDRLLLELVQAGCLTGVSAFVPRYAPVEATLALSQCQDIEWGLHLNLTDGQAYTSSPMLGSLTDRDGNFHGGAVFQRQALSRRLNRRELLLEIGTQLDQFMELFGRMDHVDSHRHVHRFPVVAAALAQALAERSLKPRVRNPARHLLPSAASRSWFRLYADYFRKDWKRVPGWLMKERVRRLLRSGGARMGDGLLTPWPPIAAGSSAAGDQWGAAFAQCPPGAWEVNLHPGWDANDSALVRNQSFQSQWQSFSPAYFRSTHHSLLP